MPAEEALPTTGFRSCLTSLRQQAMVSFGGQEHMGSGGKAAARQEIAAGEAKSYLCCYGGR